MWVSQRINANCIRGSSLNLETNGFCLRVNIYLHNIKVYKRTFNFRRHIEYRLILNTAQKKLENLLLFSVSKPVREKYEFHVNIILSVCCYMLLLWSMLCYFTRIQNNRYNIVIINYHNYTTRFLKSRYSVSIPNNKCIVVIMLHNSIK